MRSLVYEVILVARAASQKRRGHTTWHKTTAPMKKNWVLSWIAAILDTDARILFIPLVLTEAIPCKTQSSILKHSGKIIIGPLRTASLAHTGEGRRQRKTLNSISLPGGPESQSVFHTAATGTP